MPNKIFRKCLLDGDAGLLVVLDLLLLLVVFGPHPAGGQAFHLRILVYLVMYGSG